MARSIIAEQIDRDYRKEQMYKKRKRNKCKDKPCKECKAFSVGKQAMGRFKRL